MCGIAGFWHRDGAPADEASVAAMLDKIVHRGPDDHGVWIDGPVALGHRRLSILDLSPRGRQPFVTDDGQGVLTYNGEVYNFDVLRRELEAQGVTFKSTSDTEVVLYALHRWGPQRAIPRFNGMFGLGYFDRRSQTLWLARDRMGIKGVYAAERGGSFYFASEIKALLAHGDIAAKVDAHALLMAMINGRLDGRWTPFEGIEAIEPGAYWRITRGEVEKTKYFDVLRDIDIDRLIESQADSAEQALRQFEQVFRESVRIHLASDAPLATMCSGGVDSSLITALVKGHRPDVTAYVADVEGTVSEGDKAVAVGRHLGVPVRVVTVPRDEYLRNWPIATYHDDQPNHHPNDMPMLSVARACRQDGIKVLVTGEGSDELFGGYPWQADTYRQWRRYRRRARWKLDISKPWLRRIARRIPQLWPVPLADLERNPFPNTYIPSQLTKRTRLAYGLDPEASTLPWRLMRRLERVEPWEQRAFIAHCLFDWHGHMQSLLHRNDRMGMAASIETRVPFIENHLLDMAMHMPFDGRYQKGVGKWVVKTLADRFLPRDIVYAPKLGFAVDRSSFAIGTPLLRGGMLADMLKWDRGTVDELCTELVRDRDSALHMVSAEMWARIYLQGESPHELGERLVALSRPHAGKLTQTVTAA